MFYVETYEPWCSTAVKKVSNVSREYRLSNIRASSLSIKPESGFAHNIQCSRNIQVSTQYYSVDTIRCSQCSRNIPVSTQYYSVDTIRCSQWVDMWIRYYLRIISNVCEISKSPLDISSRIISTVRKYRWNALMLLFTNSSYGLVISYRC